MALPSSSNSKLTMRLLIDTNNEKVLFAETSKPVVDFLFHMLCLPMATVVKLLGKNGMVGSVGNVYQSVEDLDEIYMYPEQSKDLLLNPSASISSNEFCNLFPTIDDNDKPTTSSIGISDYILVNELDKDDEEEDDEEKEDDEDEEDYEDEKKEENCCVINSRNGEENILIKNGFVKDVNTFLVTDDLAIQPITSAIEIVEKFKLVGRALKKMVVELGVDEEMKLLKASLQSKMVLTSVFLKKEY